jgi:tRNA G10  N-methylase Trm11
MFYKSLFVLGRLPAIGRAELESLYGAEHLQPIGDYAVASDLSLDDVRFARIGSSVRAAKILTRLDGARWPNVAKQLADKLPGYLDYLPAEGKIKLGLSTFGLQVSPQQLFRTGLDLKRVCKQAGRSVRLVPNTEPTLSSAQVLHNQLTGELGLELLLLRDGDATWIAQTTDVQDITAYAKRDQGRPKRDARVGMLPPKLAQTIVNLAAGPLAFHFEHIILDPFCGTGVLLQEAALMGYSVYGTDLEPRMIEYSSQNLAWLAEENTIHSPTLQVGDATSFTWQPGFAVVASETYLGRPLASWPGDDAVRKIISDTNTILVKFLQNIGKQTPRNLRLCLAVPAWRSPQGRLFHLPLLDHLEEMGYNRVRFEHAAGDDLIYFRPDQIVTRELLVITRN